MCVVASMDLDLPDCKIAEKSLKIQKLINLFFKQFFSLLWSALQSSGMFGNSFHLFRNYFLAQRQGVVRVFCFVYYNHKG